MQNIFPFGDQLQVRLHDHPIPAQSNDDPPTATFQLVSGANNEFFLRCPRLTSLKFHALYKYNGQLFEHPYKLRLVGRDANIQNNTIVAGYEDISLNIQLFLDLTRFRYFASDDFKRYLDAVNDTIGQSPIPFDFHQFYLAIEVSSSAQGNIESQLLFCNQAELLYLPMIVSHQYDLKNTCIRERYKKEGRDGKLPCEFRLINILPRLDCFEIQISLISNGIRPRMDHRQLGWTCKTLNNTIRKKSTKTSNTHFLHHEAGAIIAKVYGPNALFSPDLIRSPDPNNYVRTEKADAKFYHQLSLSQGPIRHFIDVTVVSQAGYNRLHRFRQHPSLKRCLPFAGIDSDDVPSENKSTKLVEYKRDATKQMVVSDDNTKKTYSEKHTRFCVCVFTPQGVLVAEHICPPLRDLKEFPRLTIKRINLKKDQLHAGDTPWIYSDVDFSKSMINYPESPFELQFFFMVGVAKLSNGELESFAGLPDLCVKTSYVIGCPHILEFTMPNRFEFSAHRFYVRLSHTKSADHNDGPLYGDETALMYFALPESTSSHMHPPTFDDFIADIDQWVSKLLNENVQDNTQTFDLTYDDDIDLFGELPPIISRRG